MLSNIRRALTPNASHTNDKDLADMSIDNSPTAPNLHLHDSSLPPYSPLHVSQQDSPGYAPHTTHGNGIIMTGQHDQPIDISSHQSSTDPDHEVTDDSLLGPVTADLNEDSHDKALSLDGASGDHLQPHLEDTHSQNSLLPTAEPALSTSKSQRPNRTPTPSVINAESESRGIRDPQPFNPVNKASPERIPRPQVIGYSTSTSARVSAGREQSVPAVAEDAKMPSPSQLRQSKQSRDDSLSDFETKEAKKPRRQAMKEEASGATTEPQDAASDGLPKKRGRPKKGEDASGAITEPQNAASDGMPKKRGRPKEGEGSTNTVMPQATTRDELPKKRGRPKKEEGSTTNVKQQAVTKDGLPKKRARPEEDQGSARDAKAQRISKEDTPAKRGRPKKEAAPTADQTNIKDVTPTKRTAAPIQGRRGKKSSKQRGGATEGAEPAGIVQPADVPAADATKKRGRPKTGEGAEPAGIDQPANVPAADGTKKRGRPKKGEEATQGIETQAAPMTDTPRKRGRVRNNQDVAGSSKVETPKKSGRPKTIAQSETPKISTPAKRGRPKKEQATPKGAKPVGIVKKKSGKK